MYEKLDAYLEEIDHYLAVESGGEEILSEIRSHILEKAERQFGELTEESIEQTIADYGAPKDVAEKYLEGFHIIAPSYRKYLFRYTTILFIFHYGLTCLLFILGTGMQTFPPFFSYPI